MTPTFLLLAAVAIANTFVSVFVLRAPALSPGQRIMQLGFIWLVPILGAVVCAAVLRAQSAVASAVGKMDPLYNPGDGGGPDGQDIPGVCGCGGSDGGGD